MVQLQTLLSFDDVMVFLITLTQIWQKSLVLWLEKGHLAESKKEQNGGGLQNIKTWLLRTIAGTYLVYVFHLDHVDSLLC